MAGRPVVELAPRSRRYEGEAALLGYPQLLDAAAMLPPAERPLYLQDPDGRSASLSRTRSTAPISSSRRPAAPDFDRLPRKHAGRASPPAAAQHRRRPALQPRRRPHPGAAFMQALPGLARGGRLYAITSGRTFSAAISSLGYLRQAAGDRLTIVGEPIGDRLEFWAEGDIMQLPGLGAMLLYATERHNYMTGCPEPDCHAAIRDHPIRVASSQPDLPRR